MGQLFGWLSPRKEKVSSVSQARSERSFIPSDSAGPRAGHVLIADFDGLRGQEATTRLAEFLAARPGLKVDRYRKVLKLSGTGNLVAQLAGAAEKGREWLASSGADILLWGEAKEPLGELCLRFLVARGDVEGAPGVFGLGDTLSLPGDFDEELGGIAFAAVLAAFGPVREGSRQGTALLLDEAANGVNAFLEAPPPLKPEPLAALFNTIGNIMAAVWRMLGDESKLDRAARAYRKAMEVVSSRDMPLIWAMSQNHLAAVLDAKSGLAGDPQPLRDAVGAYRAVIKTLDAVQFPNDWAMAQVRLGETLMKLAKKTNGTTELKDAITAFEAALSVYTQNTMPVRWSDVMNRLGVVLMMLGEQVTANVLLEQSVNAFRNALKVRRRDVAPLLWAQTANNLGAATFALAKRSGENSMLNEASVCFEGAAKVYRELDQPRNAQIIEKNLHRAQRLLETR